jgi:hypothetical protein
MGILNKLFGSDADESLPTEQPVLKEEIKAFSGMGKYNRSLKTIMNQKGEGWETLAEIPGFSNVQVQGFNLFYNTYINRVYENEIQRVLDYNQMATTPEISDVIEDAVNESTQEDETGEVFHLDIIDKDLQSNENIVNNLKREFNELFRETLDMKDKVWNILWTYYVDGRVYYERVIDKSKPKKGIINIKRLPTTTMDFFYDPISGEITAFMQYLTARPKKPLNIEEARKRDGKDLTLFDPNQIGFVDYGIYGKSRLEIIGYLEKARVPFNQLKLLETSVIIMRVVRAPERYVFRIDTGNMPREKALKYVEKIKNKMSKKQSYDPSTGQLANEPEVMGILENFYLPQSADGRGSSIETIGGNTNMFSELDDVYYFQKKLYRSLKYPASRVTAAQEGTTGQDMFGGNQTSEISRDEVKWAKFLERQQKRLCASLTDDFILHLEFKGMKKEYDLTNKKVKVVMNAPSQYKEQMEQMFNDSRFSNYQQLADRPEFSKYYLMKTYLKWDEEEIQANVEGKQKDVKLGLAEEEGGGSQGW